MVEVFDLRLHEMIGNARYYPKKTAAKARRADHQPSFAGMYFSQLPVMFARRINYIGFYQVSNYTTLNVHKGSTLMHMALAE